MKRTALFIAAAVALSGPIFAGQTPIEKMVTPVEELYGLGWYGAIDGGVNVYQDLGGNTHFHRVTKENDGTRSITTRRDNTISFEPDGDGIGGFGGIKLGYVFGTGVVRPALEADLYYNGIDTSVAARVNGHQVAEVGSRIDSGAFMANSILRFSFERFQPYFGFGIGGYVAQGNDVTVKINDDTKSHASTNSDSGFAWQIVGGADYYFTPKCSLFLEYKFLNYVDAIFDNAIQQQLIGIGVRLHF